MIAQKSQPGMMFSRMGKPAPHLQGMHAGRGVFLVCGGPSINSMPMELLSQRGILTAAVNNIAATHIRPHIWIIVDEPYQFDETIWRDPAVMKFAKEKYVYGSKRRNVTAWNGQEFVESDLRVMKCPNVWGYRHCHDSVNPETFLTQDYPTWGAGSKAEDPDGIDAHKSVMLVAVRLLYWLGCRRIYLVGADFKMKKDNQYAFPESQTGKRVNGNNQLYGWLNRRFKELRPALEAGGLEVRNCTPKSKLTAFDYMDFEAAVAFELHDFPTEPHTQGHYR